jgi:hypothetical protein
MEKQRMQTEFYWRIIQQAKRNWEDRIKIDLNLLKPSGNFTYHQVEHSKILCGAHIAFTCFVWISEQTETFAL